MTDETIGPVDTELAAHMLRDPDKDWRKYRKTTGTLALRMDGPFVVQTSEGPLRCDDGYLAIDARGYPYPIATDEFELIYEEVDADGTEES